jgi:hypothetical protein
VGGAQDYRQETFLDAFAEVLNMDFATKYKQTEFNGTAVFDGKTCELWQYHVGSANSSYSEETVFCVERASGALLSANFSALEIQAGRNITEVNRNIFHNYSLIPNASVFMVPVVGQGGCVDLRPLSNASTVSTIHDRSVLVNSAARLEQLEADAAAVGWSAGSNKVFDGLSNEEAWSHLMPNVLLGRRSKWWRAGSVLGQRTPPSKHGHAPAGETNAEKPEGADEVEVVVANIPVEFDARVQWAQCTSIGRVRQQGKCGSCWAFGAVEAQADRFCVATSAFATTSNTTSSTRMAESSEGGSRVGEPSASNLTSNLTLSVEYLMDCDTQNMGCGGGLLDDAWDFLVSKGVPSEECVPYQQARGPSQPPIPCYAIQKCLPESAHPPPFHLYRNSDAFAAGAPWDVVAMQKEILSHGPIEVAFQVFSDFTSYRSGTYQRTAHARLQGGHAVKLVGWGVDSSGVAYWIVANSWGSTWGELGGFFHIRRGTNECGIEQTPAAGTPIIATTTATIQK